MVNYGVPVWTLVLEAAKELNLPSFSPADIIKKVKEKNPSVKSNTIRCHIMGMTPSHPSSMHYPSLRKNHPAFNYLGNGRFELFAVAVTPTKETIDRGKQEARADNDISQWEELREKIIGLQSDISPFKVDFLDRESFKTFCDSIYSNLQNHREIYLTGYFSETIRTDLEKLARNDFYHIRLISPEFQVGTPRDRKNLEALKKLAKAGVEVRFNRRLHARLLIGKNPSLRGILIIGSFDLNTECIGKERYDAGITTSNPDLINSAVDFFNEIWNDSETDTLEAFLKDKRIT